MRIMLLVVAFMVPAVLGAQTQVSKSAKKDRPAVVFDEIERGIFVSIEAGGFFLFSPEGESGSGFSPGRSVGLAAGTDIGEFFSLGMLVLGTQTDTPRDFVSTGNSNIRGDFSSLLVAGLVKANLFRIADSNQVERLLVTARGGGGYALLGPKDFYPGNDVVALIGLGMEYYTHLRHFSVGLQVDYVRGFSHLGSGIMVNPLMRYTF